MGFGHCCSSVIVIDNSSNKPGLKKTVPLTLGIYCNVNAQKGLKKVV